MNPILRLLLVASTVLALASCQKGQNGERGGEPERQLVEATVAVDPAKVEQLLAAGADPNKMSPYQGHLQSPWKLALHQSRSNTPATIAIVEAMLRHGAKRAIAWGEGPSRMGGYSVQSSQPIVDADTPEVTRLLIAGHPDLPGATLALESAAEAGRSEIVHILVEAGVDVNSRPTAITPLVAAIERRDVAMMTYLEDHGAREKP